MTDRDPTPRRPRTGPPTPGKRGAPSPGGAARRDPRSSTPPGAPASPPTGTSLRDRWWWSPTLSIVIGLVVVGYQLEPLRGSNPLWGNWVVAALGLVVAAYGVVRLLRAHRER